MKQIITLLFITVTAAASVLAQNTNATTPSDSTLKYQNSFYAEFGGASILAVTFNYERFLSNTPGGLSFRVGLGGGYLLGIFGSGGTLYGALPMGVSYNIPMPGNKRSMIEVGGLYSFIFGGSLNDFGSNDSINAHIPAFLFGWRHQSASGKTQIRVTCMGLVDTSGEGVLPWVGFSIGRRF